VGPEHARLHLLCFFCIPLTSQRRPPPYLGPSEGAYIQRCIDGSIVHSPMASLICLSWRSIPGRNSIGCTGRMHPSNNGTSIVDDGHIQPHSTTHPPQMAKTHVQQAVSCRPNTSLPKRNACSRSHGDHSNRWDQWFAVVGIGYASARRELQKIEGVKSISGDKGPNFFRPVWAKRSISLKTRAS